MKLVRIFSAAVLAAFMLLICGCWDDYELNALFIVTGIALDSSQNPSQMDISVQIAKPHPSSEGKSDSENEPVILMNTTAPTMSDALSVFNRNSNRTLMLQHNQVLLLGKSLAEDNIIKHLDLFMRDQETRMEVLVMVVDGRAEDIINAQLEQDSISGMFLARLITDLTTASSHYQIRMIDFVSRLLDESVAPIAPIVSLKENNGKQEIVMNGMAVFDNERMIGQLTNDEVTGYIWAMGDVSRGEVSFSTEWGTAVLNISSLTAKREISFDNEKVQVNLSIKAQLHIGQISGFKYISMEELMAHLQTSAEQAIRDKIMNSFEISKTLNADIFGFGRSIYRTYPSEWKKIREEWETVYQNLELDVNVDAHIATTGQITDSLEMEEGKSAD